MTQIPDRKSRILGGLWGSLVGDALGVPVEFQPRAARVADPVTGMRAFGTHQQPAGTWSDDGALLLCSVESLLGRGFDTDDLGRRFVQWHDEGLWTARGDVFDIGIATSQALRRIRQGNPAEQAGGTTESSNGNGSLMRILPVVLWSWQEDAALFRDRIHRASAITHRHPRSQLACVFYGWMVRSLLAGRTAPEALAETRQAFPALYPKHAELPAFQTLLQSSIATLTEPEIPSGGYVMETLLASIWCLLTTQNFTACLLKAVNLGSDTDTTGCVTGGLAGVLYGQTAIPCHWHETLPRQTELTSLLNRFPGPDRL